jgi:hypothetical protein
MHMDDSVRRVHIPGTTRERRTIERRVINDNLAKLSERSNMLGQKST